MQRKAAILFAFLLVVLVGSIVGLIYAKRPSSMPDAYQQFITNDGAEDQMMDPLILYGDAVVSLVLMRVRDREMPRRRYAISFLGNGSYREALPVLEQILADHSEDALYRGDALDAICQIDLRLGLEKARQYKAENNYLGQAARDRLANVPLPPRRSYWAALRGMHN